MEEELKRFYQKNLSQYGPSAEGVGWKNKDAQIIRFEQLARLFIQSDFSLNDLGCGVGDFIAFASERIPKFRYRGYDVMPDMITAAVRKYGHLENVEMKLISTAADMQPADYTIASGIFNIRFNKDDHSWLQYILDTLTTINARSTAGFSFNVLTRYSDKEFMKPELYYADPAFLFDFCKTNFSKNVALLHDYNQYDFTILVRKDI